MKREYSCGESSETERRRRHENDPVFFCCDRDSIRKRNQTGKKGENIKFSEELEKNTEGSQVLRRNIRNKKKFILNQNDWDD